MPRIKHLEERTRYVRVGKIALGIQVPVMTDGGKQKMYKGKPVTRPQATDHFIIKGLWPGVNEQVAELYGAEPKELDIEFLFDEEDETFPQFNKRYRGDRQLGCMGDGRTVITRRHWFESEKFDVGIVTDGRFSYASLDARAGDKATVLLEHLRTHWQDAYGWGEQLTDATEQVPCLGPLCPQFGPTGCRATARLLFGIRGIRRFGFWEMVVHQHAIIGINSQFDLTRAFTSKLIGLPTILHVPFKLRLTGPTTMMIPRRVKTDGGYVMDEKQTTVYTPEIQPDAEWVAQVYDARGPWLQLPESLGQIPAQARSISPIMAEDEVPLDYDPGTDWDDIEDDNGEGQEADKKTIKAPDWQTRFQTYVKQKSISKMAADETVKRCGGDFEKALIELRQLSGEL